MATPSARELDLGQMLIARRRDSEEPADGRAGDIEVTLSQMRSDMRTRVDAALGRLDEGTYGFCAECEGLIAERRLRALPFAMHCQDCEQRRESRERDRDVDAPLRARERGRLPLFSDLA
jgi:RNA polymerase-binding transcription factor DksA